MIVFRSSRVVSGTQPVPDGAKEANTNKATPCKLDSYLTALEETCRKSPFIELIIHWLMHLTQAKGWG